MMEKAAVLAPLEQTGSVSAWARRIRAASYLIAGLIVVAPVCSQADPMPSESGNYCVDEAKDRLQQSFGPDARITRALFSEGYGYGELWVTSNVCKGYIVFSALGKDHCTMPAYMGRPRSSFETMWGYGDCANLSAVANLQTDGGRREARAPDLPGTSGPATSP